MARNESAQVLEHPSARFDEDALVDGLAAGDKAAQAALFRQEATRLRRLVRRMVGPRSEVDDLVQETFLSAFRHAARFRPTGKAGALRAWLTRIAVNKARNHLRWRRLRTFVGLEARVLKSVSEPVAFLSEVHAVLRKLPSDEHVALVLRYVEGMTLAELADATGVSVATVKRRLARGSARVRELADPAWLEVRS